jgi:protein-S-isoprenylcysteine O-methyltransferase Ste14
MLERDRIGFRRRGWIAVVLLAPATAVAMLSDPLALEGTTLDLALDSLAWLTLAGGVALRFWATLYVGGRKQRAIVQEGPYSLCRNPLYLGSFLIACSAALFLQSAVFAVAVAAAVVAYATVTVPAEEAHLRETVGEEYGRYCERVPRFLPRLSGIQVQSPIVVHLNGLRRELLRALQWLAIPLLAEAILSLRSQPWWPHLLVCGSRALGCWPR